MPNTSPADHRRGERSPGSRNMSSAPPGATSASMSARPRPTSRAARRAGNRARRVRASRCSPAARPATCWSRTMRASKRVMRAGRRRIAYHSEDEYRLQARRSHVPARRCRMARHMEWRDEECAFLGTRRHHGAGRARPAGRRISCTSPPPRNSPISSDFRDVATVEVLVNHLTQVAPDAYDRLGGLAVMNPPIRGRAASGGGLGGGARRHAWTRSAPTTRRIRAPPRSSPGPIARPG